MAILDSSTPAAVAAPVMVIDRVRAMCSFERHLIGKKQVAAVHDMRVASRRLREVLLVFKEWLEPVIFQELDQYGRGVTKALGAVRNADVALQFFRALRRELHDDVERRAVRRFVDRIARVRLKRRETMMEAIEDLYLKRLSRDIEAFVTVPEVGAGDSRKTLGSLALPLIRMRMKQAFAYEEVVGDEAKIEELHRMRIKFKKTRYALEVFEPVFDIQYKKVYKRLVKYQDLLGQVHDLDVFIADIDKMIENLRVKNRRPKIRAALEKGVRKKLERMRHESFVSFRSYLDENHLDILYQACLESLQHGKNQQL